MMYWICTCWSRQPLGDVLYVLLLLLLLLLPGGCAKSFGWRWGMWAPGLIGCAVGLLVLAAVRDKPSDLGFSPVDAPAKAAAPAAQDAAAADASPAAGKSAGGNMMSALQQVLKLPAVWVLAFTYFFIYVVRQGVTSWLVFYLMAEKGAADAGSAALTVSGLELGGLAGSTVAGYLSDRAIRSAKPGAGLVGKRIKVWQYTTCKCALAFVGYHSLLAAWMQQEGCSPSLSPAVHVQLGTSWAGAGEGWWGLRRLIRR
jgi:sugar phosphate permease